MFADTTHSLRIVCRGWSRHFRRVLQTCSANVDLGFQQGLAHGLVACGVALLILLKEGLKLCASVPAVLLALILEVAGSHRGLDEHERSQAHKVFGNTLNLDKVRLTHSSKLVDLLLRMNGNRPFATMYVINIKSGTTLPMPVLIHELAHVWQAEQSGGIYMVEALWSQFFGRGYELTEDDLYRAADNIDRLEREQQAVLIEMYWKAEFGGRRISLPIHQVRPLARSMLARQTPDESNSLPL